jgi:hypothetical protein
VHRMQLHILAILGKCAMPTTACGRVVVYRKSAHRSRVSSYWPPVSFAAGSAEQMRHCMANWSANTDPHLHKAAPPPKVVVRLPLR